MNLSVNDIIKCTDGKLIIGNKNTICENYCIDTRNLEVGDTYIAIKGEKFDGNSFWEEAFNKGANIAILNKCNIEENLKEKYSKNNKCIIEVENTIEAIGKMALYKRNLYKNKIKIIGITGSVGKTSTKDLIASVVSEKYKTLKTEGNKNNNIGLPLTILSLKDEEVAVIEMGMNHFGELSYLSKIAKPDIAVITNIGTAHIGILGSRENILKAKLEILEGMENKTVIINNDNDLLNKWNNEQNKNLKIYTCGIENESDIMAINIKEFSENSEFDVKYNKKITKCNIPVPGKHFVFNSLYAFICGKLLKMSDEQIVSGIKKFKLTSGRMEINKLKEDIIIINDAYNASYDSMKASITTLQKMNGKRKIAVLGDMLELGIFSEKLHRDVGIEVYKNKINMLFLIGKNAKFIGEEAEKNGFNKNNIFYFENKENLIRKLEEILKSGDTILVKASKALKLWEVAQKIQENK